MKETEKNKSSAENLKWYEKKAGMNIAQKKSAQKKKDIRKQRRENEKSGSELIKQPAQKNNSNDKSKLSGKKREEKYVKCIDSLFEAASIPSDAKDILNNFQEILLSVIPLNSKQRSLLPKQIRDLSHTLTDERDERRRSYMNTTTTLSAYIHYFLWWNLVRLTRLFANMPADYFAFKDKDICLDIGSGPLTLPIALFLARPELRTKELTFYCLDISQQTLNAGENIFLSVAAKLKCQPWKIIRVKGDFDSSIKEKASFVSCANVFNEVLQGGDMPPDYYSKRYFQKLTAFTDKNAVSRILIIEPGVPSSARFLHCIRENFMAGGYKIISPCTHHEICPMLGKKGNGAKWCNFAFTTQDAPAALKKLSQDADLPKDRAVLSFLALEKNPVSQAQVTEEHILEMLSKEETGNKKLKSLNSQAGLHNLTFRIVSDMIRLPGDRSGYYACSSLGLLLIVCNEELASGQSYETKMPKLTPPTDKKSGALIIDLR